MSLSADSILELPTSDSVTWLVSYPLGASAGDMKGEYTPRTYMRACTSVLMLTRAEKGRLAARNERLSRISGAKWELKTHMGSFVFTIFEGHAFELENDSSSPGRPQILATSKPLPKPEPENDKLNQIIEKLKQEKFSKKYWISLTALCARNVEADIDADNNLELKGQTTRWDSVAALTG
ncbi:hypothetical protein BC830DRAFT_1234701 [Chytriomyces sp. MP71]|nr:hypothetical protein BC830DRAFT_1234701 [Chytriomyces sp. MP71]